MILHQYIKELLFIHDCVILPDFGGFVLNYKEATIDEESVTFKPPTKEIGFNANLKHNDGLLINYVAERRGLDYLRAKEMVSKYVAGIKDNLISKKRQFVLDEIGEFKLNKEKNIDFLPSKSANFLIDAFGLGTFTFPEISSEADSEIALKPGTLIKNLYSNPILKAAMISIPVLIAAYFTYTSPFFDRVMSGDIIGSTKFEVNLYPEDSFNTVDPATFTENPASIESSLYQLTRKENALRYVEPGKVKSTVEKEQIEEVEPEQVVENKADVVVNEVKPEKPKVEKVKEEKKPVDTHLKSETQSFAKFHIIAGSFGNYQNAEYLRTKFVDKGYQSQILSKEKGLYRVSIHAFTDKNNAKAELSELKTLYPSLSIWILTENK